MAQTCKRARACRSEALGAAADVGLDARRAEALVAAERDRCRILEVQLADGEAARREVATRAESCADGERAAKTAADDARREAARATAELRSMRGRVGVLEAQLAEAAAAAAEGREAAAAAEGERGAAAGAASKETAALSSALRAARAKCEAVYRP